MYFLIFTSFILISAITKINADLNEQLVSEHNRLRQLHGVPDLNEDVELSKGCQAYAEELATTEKFEHSAEAMKGEFGENLCYRNDPELCVQKWYDEIEFYDFAKGKFSKKTGHFTAVIWKATTRVGVGYKWNPNKKVTYVVARYLPPGNVKGQFIENVPRPLK
ncbi:Golgi-associated plant pathogenesis-related protein 1-like [Drosophila tropicalis]|uniref:Golgi-associated plant pathogenesis-related protein 1-like n=1 Tax=Drosophila tropicalis TaxID=46794 RepID=UPI0035AC216F